MSLIVIRVSGNWSPANPGSIPDAYSDAFPVNSGYFNSLTPNSANAAARTYPAVKAQTQVDLGMSYKLPIAQKVTWSLNVSNVLDDRESTFPGTPAIGRLIVTRLRYEF